MILPITTYGDPVLKRKADAVPQNLPDLDKLIADMYETMYNAHGVGLAAPQIGLSLRLFITDGSGMQDNYPEQPLKEFRKVFINPEILSEDGALWGFEEGCLSIPNIRETVKRKPVLKIRYQNEKFETIEEVYDGVRARIIQHEYDHILGVLFTDKISTLRKKLIKNKLVKIQKGDIEPSYPMKVYKG